jgi:hypothetical protein
MRVVSVIAEGLGTAGVLLTGAVEALNDRAVVGATQPGVASPELEARDLGGAFHRVQRREQRGNVHTVKGRAVCGLRHDDVS